MRHEFPCVSGGAVDSKPWEVRRLALATGDPSRNAALNTLGHCRSTALLSRLVQKLLEEPAQLERRALAAVRHQGRRDVARAIELPVADRRAAQSRITLWAALAAVSLLASDPALALARQQLPAGTRA